MKHFSIEEYKEWIELSKIWSAAYKTVDGAEPPEPYATSRLKVLDDKFLPIEHRSVMLDAYQQLLDEAMKLRDGLSECIEERAYEAIPRHAKLVAEFDCFLERAKGE